MFSIERVVWKWLVITLGAILMVVVVVEGEILRLGWVVAWECFVVSLVVVGCCFGGCGWYMRLVDAL
jgi:hypothetical protein